MKRGTLLAIVLAILVAAIAVALWMARNNEAEAPVIPAEPSEPTDTASVEPAPLPPPPAPEPEPVKPEPAETAPEEPDGNALQAFTEALKDAEQRKEDADEKPFEGVPITEETLTGVKYKEFDGKVEVEFAANHKWLINGRERAKWEIVGSKVRIYDDKGEEHWVDIDGDKLLFEGQRLELWK